jgi:hypothetical protein
MVGVVASVVLAGTGALVAARSLVASADLGLATPHGPYSSSRT